MFETDDLARAFIGYSLFPEAIETYEKGGKISNNLKQYAFSLADLYRRTSDAKKSIVNNIYATELTAFASFLCELNTVIQILPLVKSLEARKNQKIDVLRIFKKDSLLQAFNHEEIGIKETAYPEVHILDSSKEMKFHILQNKNDFDFVVGNPPYVGESGHKELFRPLQDHPYWKKHYLGKSDYLYYFIILGLNKLKDGGKLAFI